MSMTTNTKPTIEFVYFDLGNILLAFDPKIACQNIADRLGREPSAIKAALYQSGLQDKFEHGSVSVEQFFDELAGHLSIDELSSDTPEILDAMSDMFAPIESMVDIASRVKAKVGRIGILSNTCLAHWDWIGRQNYPTMQAVFDKSVLSFEIGSMKPEPQIYEVAESMCKVEPSKILFIDDREENVLAARSRGWNAEVCMGGAEAIAVLEQYEVLS